MSTPRKQLNKLVSDKMKTRGDRLREAGQDEEALNNVLMDYKLYFDGANDALSAAGVEPALGAAVKIAAETNEAEIALADRRVALQNELDSED